MDGDTLKLEYGALYQAVLWERNPKQHDIGGIWESIVEHGFKDPPKFEPALNDGRGGIVEGNGRCTALVMMQKQGQEPPRGIGVVDGIWYVPVLFGVDAESQSAAERYAIDHNNLTMLGGEFAPWEVARMYDDVEYTARLKELAEADELPVSVDGDELDALMRELGGDVPEAREYDESIAGEVEYLECPECGHKWPK